MAAFCDRGRARRSGDLHLSQAVDAKGISLLVFVSGRCG